MASVFASLVLACDLSAASTRPEGVRKDAPNVIVVLIDDSGYADSGAFGGTARTPYFDRLAAGGLRYNRFHTAAICTATRAALLSGLNHHHAGFGTLSDIAGQASGYNSRWKENVPSIAKVLLRAGYGTAAIGKWHNTPWTELSPAGPFDRWPTGLGFDYFYGFMQPGASSLWDPHSMYLNTTAIEPTARAGETYHMTTDLADRAIDWVRAHQAVAPGKPYFLYLAPGAVHFPHHVPTEWIEKYRGQFDQGWDEYRRQVFSRQKKLGVIPADAELTSRPDGVPAWDSLSADQKRFYAHEMEVYAGLVEHTDHEVGRFLEAVQAGPDGDNTLILYIHGDNGGSAGAGAGDELAERLKQMDEMGGPLHNNGIESGWAWAVSTPFQRWKGFASHLGAVRNPLVVSWPARIKDQGGLRTQFAHVNDVAATIYECVGIKFPDIIDGMSTIPLDGVSFASTFDASDAESKHHTQYFEMFGNRAIYHKGWIAATRHTDINYAPPRGEENNAERWELYHIDRDFSEAHDLASRHPDKLAELKALFEAEARRNDAYPLGQRGPRARSGIGYGQPAKPESVVYHTGLPRLLGIAAPNFVRSHVITADVVIPDATASGVIVSCGSRWDGFALYVKDNRLVFESKDSDGPTTTIVSQTPLPLGKIELGYEYEAGGPENGHWGSISRGTVRLLVNGQLMGQAKANMHESSAFWGAFGIGKAFGASISQAFQPPFPFTGSLEKVTVRLP